MRTGVYYKATGGVHGVDPKFFGNPRPPGSRNDGSPPETSSLETLPSSGESTAKPTFVAKASSQAGRLPPVRA